MIMFIKGRVFTKEYMIGMFISPLLLFLVIGPNQGKMLMKSLSPSEIPGGMKKYTLIHFRKKIIFEDQIDFMIAIMTQIATIIIALKIHLKMTITIPDIVAVDILGKTVMIKIMTLVAIVMILTMRGKEGKIVGKDMILVALKKINGVQATKGI